MAFNCLVIKKQYILLAVSPNSFKVNVKLYTDENPVATFIRTN